MGYSYQRQRRYVAYFWAFVTSLAFALSPIAPALAQNTITWEDLQSQSTDLYNPYDHLTTAQTYQLSDLYQLREWIDATQPGPDSLERRELKRLENSLAADGIDADELLKEVEAAEAYWSAQSRTTNSDLVGGAIRIDGYVLPLGESQMQGINQSRQMTEFLLVPYVGACIHVPAPPPNQMVYIQTAQAVENPGTFSPVRVEGELQAQDSSHKIFQIDGSRTVDVSYTMSLTSIAPTSIQPIAPPQVDDSLTTPQGWRSLPVRISNILTNALNQVQSQRSPQAFMVALLLSLGYGILHTLGPGHGKAVIVSYFVGQGGSLQRGLLMGGQIAIFHVLSAILLVIFTNTVISQVGGAPGSNYRAVQLISYGAIALLGGWMLRQTLRTKAHQPAKLQTAGNVDSLLYPSLSQQVQTATRTSDPTQTVDPTAYRQRRRSAIQQDSAQKAGKGSWIACSCSACDGVEGMSGWLALAVGAVPCSGALLVLLYGLANNMLWQSIAMVMAISAGMALTLSWIGIMAIFTHRWGNQVMQQRREKQPKAKQSWALSAPFARIGQVVGASCVCLVGVFLFTATWMMGT